MAALISWDNSNKVGESEQISIFKSHQIRVLDYKNSSHF